MRGSDGRSGALFSYVDLEDRVPRGHPLRPIRTIVNETLDALSGDFERLYGRIGRLSISPEKLLRALLLQAFYSIRSERQLMERLDFDLLFRWFPRVARRAARGQAQGSASMIRCGTTRPSPRTAIGCLAATWRHGSSPKC
jgi:Transposase domain (DUF772)